MTAMNTPLQIKDKTSSLLFSIIFLFLCFVYLFWRLDPKLIYQAQEPVFFFDPHFMRQFLHEPGGLNDLLASFLSQFFYLSWTGSLLLVALFTAIAWNTKSILKSVNGDHSILYLHWIPTIFLLVLHSNYKYPLVFTLGLLLSLTSVNVYVRFAPTNKLLRLLFYIILHSVLYYVVAGNVFVFSLIVLTYEIFYHRKIVTPLFYGLVAVLIPYLGARALFIMSIRDAYRLQLTFYETYTINHVSWVLYAFFTFVIVLKVLGRKFIITGDTDKITFYEKFLFRRSTSIQFIQGLIFLIIAFLASQQAFDQSRKSFIQIDYYSRFGEWEKVLDLVKQGRAERSIVESQAYRALYHCGRLCDELFSLTKHFGGDGLFMHSRLAELFPIQHSDLFFDLGILNEAEHWAYEAISITGETPWNLQRLALVFLFEGNRDVAARYLGMLKQTMWHRKWARTCQKLLDNTDDLSGFPQYRYLNTAIPYTDFLLSPIEPERCLEELIKCPGNKMAFEYYMAHCLLSGNLNLFIEHLHRLNDFNYTKIPRHFEEAILIYIQLTGRKDINLPGRSISRETVRKFVDFNQILARHDKNINNAYIELERKHRDTYWFYALYQYKPKDY